MTSGSVFDNENRDVTPDKTRTPIDISTFTPSYRWKTEEPPWSVDFTARENKVIPWPVSPLSRHADQIITNVQIAIEDQAYAKELQRLLEKENGHRAYIVDRPNPAIDGVVVLDETTLGHVETMGRTDARRYIVLREEFSDPGKIWDMGVRCVLPKEYPPGFVRMAILWKEL